MAAHESSTHFSSRPKTPPRGAGIAFIAASAAVLALHVAYIVGSLLFNRVGFDSAYNLTVSRNLAAGLGYVSDGLLVGVQQTPFDVRISTGPTVLLPASLGYLGDGDGLLVARAVTTLFYVAMVLALVMIGRRVGGPWAALTVSLSPLTIDMLGAFGWSELLGPTDVVGEMAATAFILFAILCVARPGVGFAAVGGGLLGLAIVTKLIAAITAPAFLLALLWGLVALPRSRVIARTAAFAAAAAAPMVLWQAFILVSLGRQGYSSNLAGQIDFLRNGGSGLNSAPGGAAHLVPFLHSWHLPVVGAIALLLAFAVLMGAFLGRIGARHDLRALAADHVGNVAIYTALAGSACLWVAWWVFIARPNFARAMHPGAVMLAAAMILGTLVAVRTLSGQGQRAWMVPVSVAAVLALAGVQSVQTVRTTWSPSPVTLQTQQRIGDALGAETQSFLYWRMGNAERAIDPFSIAMANDMSALPLERRTDETMLYVPTSLADAPGAIAELCGEIRYDADDVVICALRP